MSHVGRADKKFLRSVRRDMARLQDADVVIAALPDGTHFLVKGSDRLNTIKATGVGQTSNVLFLPAPHTDAAVALEQVLGRDGAYYNQGPVGHA